MLAILIHRSSHRVRCPPRLGRCVATKVAPGRFAESRPDLRSRERNGLEVRRTHASQQSFQRRSNHLAIVPLALKDPRQSTPRFEYVTGPAGEESVFGLRGCRVCYTPWKMDPTRPSRRGPAEVKVTCLSTGGQTGRGSDTSRKNLHWRPDQSHVK
jgi:hypothetical protein